MGNNPSVRQFRTDMMQLSNQVGKNFHQIILDEADELIANMRDAAPKETGRLAASLRKKDVTKGSSAAGHIQEVSVLVIGGGPPTIKRTSTGHAYDYSVATEFGTRKENPEPFFYTTFRKYRNQGLEIFEESLDKAIEENNKLRALRASPSGQNFSNYRGAVIFKKK